MTEDERLRAVEMSAIKAHERIEAHNEFCKTITEQNGREFKDIKNAQEKIQSSLTWISRFLLGMFSTFVVTGMIAYFVAHSS